MVSDALLISKLAGYMLLVVRHNVTNKQLLTSLLEEMNRNRIKGLNIVYNNMPIGKKGYYKYGYRFGYYYANEKKGLFSRFLS